VHRTVKGRPRVNDAASWRVPLHRFHREPNRNLFDRRDPAAVRRWASGRTTASGPGRRPSHRAASRCQARAQRESSGRRTGATDCTRAACGRSDGASAWFQDRTYPRETAAGRAGFAAERSHATATTRRAASAFCTQRGPCATVHFHAVLPGPTTGGNPTAGTGADLP
jgi:hypothetical protein